jgi:hypothetical protein
LAGLAMEAVGIFVSFCYILGQFGICYGHSLYFTVIWYIFYVLVSYTKKNLATLLSVQKRSCSDAANFVRAQQKKGALGENNFDALISF